LTTLMLFTGCGNGSGTTAIVTTVDTCIPKLQTACACPGGLLGVQTCNDAGSNDVCLCGNKPGAEPAADSGPDVDSGSADEQSTDAERGSDAGAVME
jgi:hypothetical protein